jgi:hypothetical protein
VRNVAAGYRGTSLAPDDRVFWRIGGLLDAELSRLVPELDALATLAGDVDRKLAVLGIGGIEGAAASWRRLHEVLDGISSADLERMAEEVRALERRLTDIAERVSALRDVKARIERADGSS